jgi:hypothetical protein
MMATPRSLVYTLYTHWETVEALVRLSRDFPAFTVDQVMSCIAKRFPQLDGEARQEVLRALVSSDIMQGIARSADMQMNAYVLEFVRGLSREHELGLAAVLQARVSAIRDATEALNEGVHGNDLDRARNAAKRLSEIFRQISLQLDQDRNALLELAENAKSADASMPVARRYRYVLEAYDQYVEPMNQMMDTGPKGVFYRYLEDAERALDWAVDRLTVQGGLYTHRQQLRQVSHQAKDLRRFGRMVAQQCADTLLPLREELRQHNTMASAISRLLGQVRKRGLRLALAYPGADNTLPVWRHERGFRVQLGGEVRAVMAAARHYQPQRVPFPPDESASVLPPLERVDEAAILEHMRRSMPVDSLLDWLREHYGHLRDATLLRVFHELAHGGNWKIEPKEHIQITMLQSIRVSHNPHRVSLP